MSIRAIHGDCRDVLKTLPDESVHCVVTSPPYFGLRDYGTGQWEGGDPACEHKPNVRNGSGRADGIVDERGQRNRDGIAGIEKARTCRCGARRIDSQIGLEATPDAYVAELVAVFREVRRVLRNDGTLWLNMGDSYVSAPPGNKGPPPDIDGVYKRRMERQLGHGEDASLIYAKAKNSGLKTKDLIGMPWMVAFALRADGWYLRSEIIWAKPNPMPESVRDRPTKAHEQIFLLSKSPRYFYDAEAIREPVDESQIGRVRSDVVGGKSWKERQQHGIGGRYETGPQGDISESRRNGGSLALAWQPSEREGSKGTSGKALRARPEVARSDDLSFGTRNKRSVWEIATAPFPSSHFATFPPALIEPCIKAGCPAKACATCGKPWVREVERTSSFPTGSREGHPTRYGDTESMSAKGFGMPSIKTSTKTLGFSPSCSCNAATVPGVVLDPFGGAGTTGLVADRLGRDAILIELNEDYSGMSRRRITDDAPLFAEVLA